MRSFRRVSATYCWRPVSTTCRARKLPIGSESRFVLSRKSCVWRRNIVLRGGTRQLNDRAQHAVGIRLIIEAREYSDAGAGNSVTELDQLKREAVYWIERLTSGQATEDDAEAFRRWRQQSQAHESAFISARQLWDDVGPAGANMRQRGETLPRIGRLAGSRCVGAVTPDREPSLACFCRCARRSLGRNVCDRRASAGSMAVLARTRGRLQDAAPANSARSPCAMISRCG